MTWLLSSLFKVCTRGWQAGLSVLGLRRHSACMEQVEIWYMGQCLSSYLYTARTQSDGQTPPSYVRIPPDAD